MIRVPHAPRYSENSQRTQDRGGYPCAVCGRHIPRPTWEVHLHDGGGWIVTEAEAATLPSNADLGMYPIGADCLRAHPELRSYARRT